MKSLPKRKVHSYTLPAQAGRTLVTRVLVPLFTVYSLLFTVSSTFAQLDFSSEELKRRALPAAAPIPEDKSEGGCFWQKVLVQGAPPCEEPNIIEKLFGFLKEKFIGEQGFLNFIKPATQLSATTSIGLAAEQLRLSLYPAGQAPSPQSIAQTGTPGLVSQVVNIGDINLQNPVALTVSQIDSIVFGTPLAGLGSHFAKEAERTKVNPALILAIAWLQTNFGQVGAGVPPCYALGGNTASDPKDKRCPRPSAEGGYYVPYNNYEDAVSGIFDLLRTRYFNPDDLNAFTIDEVESRYDASPQVCNLQKFFVAFSEGINPKTQKFLSRLNELSCE